MRLTTSLDVRGEANALQSWFCLFLHSAPVEGNARRLESHGGGFGQELRAADEENAAGPERSVETSVQLVFDLGGKVDDDIAADDEVEAALERISQQVVVSKRDLAA